MLFVTPFHSALRSGRDDEQSRALTCHDLAYGKLFPTEGRDLRGLSQLGHLDHVLVRKSTGQFPLPVDGTSRDTGLPSRTTRRGLSTE